MIQMNFYDANNATNSNNVAAFQKRPTVSVVVPMYNAAPYLRACIDSVLKQTYKNIEIIAVDDGSPDECAAIISSYDDPRIRLIRQANRGLAGARNTGIRNARGRYIAFLDSDDIWHANKLEKHVGHLDSNPEVGVSYSASAFINEQGEMMGLGQHPKTHNIEPQDIFCRNPIGNGSAPVIRRETLDEIRFIRGESGHLGYQYFDETFRQSEDVECWLRIALSTNWKFEGLADALTYYRVNGSGLSANWKAQLASWERSVANNAKINKAFIQKWESLARAYQYRYLARRAVQSRDSESASQLMQLALQSDKRIFLKEFAKTSATLGSTLLLSVLNENRYDQLERKVINMVAA